MTFQTELDQIAKLGFDWVWFLSVWQTGQTGQLQPPGGDVTPRKIDKPQITLTEKGNPMKKSDPTKKKPALRAARRAPGESVREEIARAAYSIWEQEGRPEGRNVEHWTQAEVQIHATRDIESCQG